MSDIKFKLFPQQTGTFWSGTKTSTNNHVIQLWWESNVVHKPARSTNKPSGSGDLIYVLQYWTSLSRSQRSDFVFLSKCFFFVRYFSSLYSNWFVIHKFHSFFHLLAVTQIIKMNGRKHWFLFSLHVCWFNFPTHSSKEKKST